MIKSLSNLSEVKTNIQRLYSKEVSVTVNLGRNKFVSYVGKLTGVYPALFTVSPINGDFKGKTTYSYSEYMCGKVKLKERVTP